MDIYIELMSIEWINSKVLLYNMGNHIQYPAITHNRKKYKKECVCIYIYVCVCVCVKGKLLSRVWLFETPWNSPGQNTGVDSLSLLQGMFPTQGSKPGLPHCRQRLYHLSHQGSPDKPHRFSESWFPHLWTMGVGPFSPSCWDSQLEENVWASYHL